MTPERLRLPPESPLALKQVGNAERPKYQVTTLAPARLEIRDLHLRHPGVAEVLASAYYAVASVCLGRHRSSPATLGYADDVAGKGTMIVEWESAAPGWTRSFSNIDEATRDAAY